MAANAPVARQAGCIAIGGRGILIEGPSGSGKSSLALALIDRGGELVGDDSLQVSAEGGRLIARPHPRTRGLLEVRNLGLLPFPCREAVPVALAIALDPEAPRYIEEARIIEIEGIALPLVRIWPQADPPAIKAELALRHYGLQF
ncbi:HPr kinase/phosphorylase [Novosphingobium mangrovi (ex Huang et al. 2023)]|uniref:HPr kinase/phosphatase C-terminal domain-containing protein n=1 Tax=Novosphingobium mangrovi (ex Huang et al. 2023) TaxID=2976432 RepID=A0ABT2I467_9SPHN|nr:HPr kinase/phosphatase C-terminal domain-containing protein [Novosphingobium mangrovi (ex Huang et al. 2023)]MCT2399387.1 HPr kinase/phosphatase C-terminal domain-containing protein [Novosphingobium mangrovi (ex Huang et al. 2023)]